jgi:hypothetical protein
MVVVVNSEVAGLAPDVSKKIIFVDHLKSAAIGPIFRKMSQMCPCSQVQIYVCSYKHRHRHDGTKLRHFSKYRPGPM